MRHVLTVEQMRAADKMAIKEFNIPGAILMENAARSSAEYIIEIMDELGFNNQNPCNDPLIDIICGSGNNGGDGFALARHLHELFRLRIFWIGEKSKMSPETLSNFKSVGKLPVEITHIDTLTDLKSIEFSKDCIIDSMIGVGGSENIKGIALDILKKIKNTTALKIAIDSPTGLNTDSGIANSYCFNADFTISMFAEKIGMLVNDGPDVCGTILIAYLGAPETIIEHYSNTHILENYDIGSLIPARKRISSKFDFGRVFMLAGSKKYPGAGALCANSAIVAGAGLVYLHSTKIHHSLLPEIIPLELPQTNTGSISKLVEKELRYEANKSDAIALGPGLSDDNWTTSLIVRLLQELSSEKRVVIDADGLRAINKKSKLNKNTILTPHTGEFSRITGIPRDEIEKRTFELSIEWSNQLNCILVLKHVPVIITDGKQTFINEGGNPGMASGGSGDVLTGLIAGLLAQGIEPLHSAALGTFIHAKAADLYTGQYSQETLTASALLDYIPEVMSNKL
ncbi:MAG: NAD(P)H-hydrate dehydratase [bacterium]